MEKTKTVTVEVCDPKRIIALATQAEKGDMEALSALRKEMDMDSIIWETLGNTRETYQEKLIESIAGHILEKESIKRWMDAEAEALAGENATPIERLLALRVTLDGVYLNKVETAVLHNQKPGETYYLSQAEYDQHRVDSAHKRYITSLKTLSQARKFLSHDARGKNRKPRQSGISYKHSGHTMNGNGNESVAIPEHASN